jgi:hypothetical protein
MPANGCYLERLKAYTNAFCWTPAWCNSTSGSGRKDESAVKGVRVLAAVGTTVSKRVWDSGIKGEEI